MSENNYVNKNNDESPVCSKTIRYWTEGDTKKLLDLYSVHLADIGPLKKFRNKKEMWVEISTEIPHMSPKQCEERYKTVLKRKKQAIENNTTSGAKRKLVEFEDELNKICSLYDSIEPEIQISSQRKIKKENFENAIPSRKERKKYNLNTTLQEIAKKKEESKERRHREKLEEVRNTQIILQKLLEKLS